MLTGSSWITESVTTEKGLNIEVEMITDQSGDHAVFKSFLDYNIFKCNPISTNVMKNHGAVICVH